MPTIVDVANRAGVAAITVSRVVNDSGPVSKQVRARVEQAIAEIGYVPNSVARSLRSKRTDTIALVVTDMTNPFFTTVARGVEDAASDAGLMLIICNTDERDDDEQRYVRMLLQSQMDGILLVPARQGSRRSSSAVSTRRRSSWSTDGSGSKWRTSFAAIRGAVRSSSAGCWYRWATRASRS